MTVATLHLLALPFLVSAPPSPGRIDPGLRELVAAMDRAWNAHDAEAQVALFAEDATLVTPTGTRAEGKAALLKVMGSKGPTRQTTSVMTIDGVQEIAPGIVLMDASQHLEGPGTKILGTDLAHVVIVARQQGKRWEVLSVRPFPKPAHPQRK